MGSIGKILGIIALTIGLSIGAMLVVLPESIFVGGEPYNRWTFWITFAGSITSVVSLGISLWVMQAIREVRTTLAARIRVPQLEDALSNKMKQLRGHVGKKRWVDAKSCLTRADSDLEALENWVEEDSAKKKLAETRTAIQKVVRLQLSENNSTAAMDIVSLVDGVVQSSQHARKDSEARGS